MSRGLSGSGVCLPSLIVILLYLQPVPYLQALTVTQALQDRNHPQTLLVDGRALIFGS